MKKLLIVALVLILLVVIVLREGYTRLGQFVRTRIETVGTKATGTPVSLKEVELALFSGRIKVSGVAVGNPGGFTSKQALEVGKASVGVDLNSIREPVVKVKSILIDGVRLTWERWNGDNLKRIKENVRAFSENAGGGKKERAPEQSAGRERKYIIQDFTLQNIAVSLVIGGKELATIKPPDLHLSEVGRQQGGQTLRELVNLVYKQLFANAQVSVAHHSGLLRKKAGELKLKGDDTLWQISMGRAGRRGVGGRE